MASNLSVSVTDVAQVVPITEPETILNGFLFEKNNKHKAIDLTYPVEYGVSLTGRFKNDNGKPEKATLTVLQMKPRTMMMATANEQGIFSLTGLNFYDTATYSFKADKAKNYPYGKVELLPRDVPALKFKESMFTLRVQNAQSIQRIISEYEVPKDVRMLESVEVKASRIEEEHQKDYRVKRPYGKPDHVLKSKDINTAYGNLIYALVGKIPGLIVRPESNSIGFSRAGAQSINFGGEPLVTINDVAMGGNAFQTLSSINPLSVESIEFTSRINVLYGSQGASGVISIYTKQGLSEEDLIITPNFQKIRMFGYSSTRSFKFPDYDDKATDLKMADYRSTLYWNPTVIIDTTSGTTSVSFFASDLQGKYRIVAEGVTQNGEPIRSVYFLDVDNN